MKKWPGWYAIPARKPLAVISFSLVAVIAVYCTITGSDLPPNISEVVKWTVLVCVGGYTGTSTIEAIKSPELTLEEPKK